MKPFKMNLNLSPIPSTRRLGSFWWPFGVRGLVGEAVLLPVIGEGHPASLSFADLDNDGDMEIANAVMLGTNPPIHHDTTSMAISFFGTDFPKLTMLMKFLINSNGFKSSLWDG